MVLEILYVAAGFFSGFANTLAGSGSILTLPLLLFAGLDIHMANGTNRVAILLQNLVASQRFHGQGILDPVEGFRISLPACVGAALGALLASYLPPAALRGTVGPLMLLLLISTLFGQGSGLELRPPPVGTLGRFRSITLMFLAGIYGGFIQVGVGLLVLSALVVGEGKDLVRGNALKVLIILLFTVPALVVFVARGQVDWRVGAMLAIGSIAGAWVGAHVTMSKGPRFVRAFVIVVLVVTCLQEFGILAFVIRFLGEIR